MGESVVEPLMKLLRDKDSRVRWSAARGLIELGAVDATVELLREGKDIRGLTEALRHKRTNVCLQATRVLAQLGAVNALIKVLEDKDPDVRRQAAEGLKEIGERAVEPLIKRSILDNSGLLTEIGKKAVEGLIKALRDEGSGSRQAAARVLGKISDPRAVEALGDKSRGVLSGVVDALAMIKDKRAVEPLVKVLGRRKYIENALDRTHVTESVRSRLGSLGMKEQLSLYSVSRLTLTRIQFMKLPREVIPL